MFPDEIERKTLFGLTLEQKRNDAVINKAMFGNVVTEGIACVHNLLLIPWAIVVVILP